MRRLIARTFPAHGIVGEEYGPERADAEFVWVLDPIDGTRSFITGLPVWGTLIGLLEEGRPVLGMMAQPFTGERFAGDGAAPPIDGPGGRRALHTRPARRSPRRRCSPPARYSSAAASEAYRRIESAVRLARYGCDCYAYCMVAAGQADIVVEAGLQPYDIVALIPVVEGAGGVVTTWTGKSAAGGGAIVAAGDRRLHELALKRLNG